MVTLPHRYKGLFDREHEILGWKGQVLQTRVDGKVWTLTAENTAELLQSLGLKESDIPGREKIPDPPIRKRAIHEMVVEEVPENDAWEDFPTRRGIVP